MPDLNSRWHGQPLWLWYVGGTIVAAGTFIFVRRYRSNKAAATNATGTNAGAYPGATGFPAGAIGQPLPGMGAVVPIINQFSWNPPDKTNVGNGGSYRDPNTNPFKVGMVVNQQSGERIVESVYNPTLNTWMDLTNLGGVYTSPSGKLLGSQQSYLGYVAQKYGQGTPQAQQEIALHGNFGPGGLRLNPDGSYALTNVKGETYNFFSGQSPAFARMHALN